MLKRLLSLSPVRFAGEILAVYLNRRASRSAAELAYFCILSFFPLMICINAFVGQLNLDVALVVSALEDVLPAESISALGDYIAYVTANQSGAMLVAGLSMILFSASAAFRALMNIMSDIYRMPTYKGFFQVLASVVFSVLLLATIYLSIAVLLTGNWFLSLAEGRFPWLAAMVAGWQWMRFLVLFCLVTVLVLLIYRMAAPRVHPRPPVLLGGLLAAGVLVAASMVFSWFIGMSSRYSLVYGSLASVIILLVWLYLCGNILILGNIFNFVWYRRRRG